MKSPIHPDFSVTVDHRNYCAKKWGCPFLADVWLTDFIEIYLDNGYKHKDWNLTYKRFLRNNSPSGMYYKPDYWERMMQRAKQLQFGERKREHRYDVREREDKTMPKPITDIEVFRKLRQEYGV